MTHYFAKFFLYLRMVSHLCVFLSTWYYNFFSQSIVFTSWLHLVFILSPVGFFFYSVKCLQSNFIQQNCWKFWNIPWWFDESLDWGSELWKMETFWGNQKKKRETENNKNIFHSKNFFHPNSNFPHFRISLYFKD